MPIWFKDPMKSLIWTDTTLYQATDIAVELTAALEGDLIRLINWVIDNGLVLNESKTQLLLLARKCLSIMYVKIKKEKGASTTDRTDTYYVMYKYIMIVWNIYIVDLIMKTLGPTPT